MSSTIVHLVRHAEVHNPDRVLYGRLSGFGLSEAGWGMAEATARRLASPGHEVQAVVSSPLRRAQQTASVIAEACGVASVVTDQRVTEAENVFEGREVRWALRDPRSWWHLRDPVTPSWGEPYRLMARRMVAAIRAVRAEAEGGAAVIVSHQAPIWVTFLAAEGRSYLHAPWQRTCRPASVTSFHFEGEDLLGTTYAEPARSWYAWARHTR